MKLEYSIGAQYCGEYVLCMYTVSAQHRPRCFIPELAGGCFVKVRRRFLHGLMPAGAILLAACFAAACWGIAVGSRLGASLGQFALRVLQASVTVPNLLISLLWPFLLVVPGVAMIGIWFCFPVCMMKGFSFGLCMGLLLAGFGSSGGLACLLLMMPDFGMLAALLWYCCRRLHLHDSRCYGDLLLVGCAAGLLVLADRLLLTPFLAELFFW